ncbi:MAG: hypothetical protein D3903_06210 [Candidatus Electrothrix sp. GM3_4]|nr:hypothetical protein [Candidatus Electrothrix sp. GM3_4]
MGHALCQKNNIQFFVRHLCSFQHTLFHGRTLLFFSEKKAIILNIGSNTYRLRSKNKINELLAVFLHLRREKEATMVRKNRVEQR